MGVFQSKLKFLVLPAQSGKTRKMEEEIKRFKLIHDLFGNGDINFVISANNCLLVQQTNARLTNDAVVDGQVFSWTYGEKTGISVEALAFRILGGVKLVVVCANAIRLSYLAELITTLTGSSYFNKKINIWIDEADKSIKLWSKYSELLSLPAVNQVTLISATTSSIFAKYGSIAVLPYQITHPACYRRLKDMKQKVVDLAEDDPLTYVQHVVEKTSLLAPGLRGFVPGDSTKASHDAIADFFFKKNVVVIILNGTRKEMLIPGRSPINLRPYLSVEGEDLPEEFNDVLSRLYTEHDLARWPLIITGYLCVQRGVTFQCAPKVGEHGGFLFDFGIIPPISDKSEAYQCMARLFGNIGDFPAYKPCTIYSNSATFRRVASQEEIAVNLARMVQEEGLLTVNKTNLKAAENYEDERHLEHLVEEFSTRAAANCWLKSKGARQNHHTADEDAPGGFLMSSTTGVKKVLDYAAVKKEMGGWSKTSNFGGILKKGVAKSGASGRMYICYKDIAVPSPTFICRVVRKKAPSSLPSAEAMAACGGASSNPFD